MEQHIINVDAGLCVGCGLCRRDCPHNNIELIDKKATIKEQDCLKCGHCVAVCPKTAISMGGFDEPPEEFSQQTVLEPRQLLQAIKERRSIRHFQNKEVSPEIIRQVIEAGRYTPSAVNAQDVSYVVLMEEKEQAEKIAVALFRKLWGIAGLFVKIAKKISPDEHFFLKKAPVAIVVVSDNKINGSLAASNMALMAEANGLGVLYSGLFTIAANHSAKLRKTLGLMRRNKVVTTLVLGYPDVAYYRTAQKESAVVHYR